MAAPHALLVLDIVEEIVDRAAVVGSRRESKQLLARLARVSSIFRDPALRRLWAELMFLDPLFRLLTNCHRNSGALQPDSVEDDDPEANSVERMLGHPSREERHARFRLVSVFVYACILLSVARAVLMLPSDVARKHPNPRHIALPAIRRPHPSLAYIAPG